jgi:hypothetical protein
MHCLVTASTVTDGTPAMYFSRGNRHTYLAAIEAEDGLRSKRASPQQQFFADEDRMQAVG